MKEITVNESYELFLMTLHRLDTDLAEDETGLNLEELQSDYYTWFHYNTASRIHEAGLILHETLRDILLLRQLIHNLQSDWTVEAFTTDPHWNVIRKLAKEIRDTLKEVGGQQPQTITQTP